LAVFQAINCLATIIPSLRDNKRSVSINIPDSTPPIEHEHEDDDEDDAPRCRAVGLAEAGERVANQKLGDESGVYYTVLGRSTELLKFAETIHRS
jgi:hypothetical protein